MRNTLLSMFIGAALFAGGMLVSGGIPKAWALGAAPTERHAVLSVTNTAQEIKPTTDETVLGWSCEYESGGSVTMYRGGSGVTTTVYGQKIATGDARFGNDGKGAWIVGSAAGPQNLYCSFNVIPSISQ